MRITKDSKSYGVCELLFDQLQKRGISQLALSFEGGGDDGSINREINVYHTPKVNLGDVPSNPWELPKEDAVIEMFEFIDMCSNDHIDRQKIDHFLYTDCVSENFDGDVSIQGVLVIDALEAKIVKAVAYEVRSREEQLPLVIDIPELRTGKLDNSLADEI